MQKLGKLACKYYHWIKKYMMSDCEEYTNGKVYQDNKPNLKVAIYEQKTQVQVE